MMNKTDRDNWRKFLGIKDPQTALDAARIGAGIGKTVGNSGGQVGGGGFSDGNPPDGDDSDGAEKGDGAGDAGEQIKQGDEFDRLEDLYDCETGEEVTIDGMGGGGSQPSYPTGFDDCKPQDTPADFEEGYYWEAKSKAYTDGVQILNTTGYFQRQSAANNFCKANPNLSQSAMDALDGSFLGGSSGCKNAACKSTYGIYVQKIRCSVTYNAVCDLPPPKNSWPAPDKNHLVWNSEKGCMEPLCSELNNQVSDKYKSCNDEMVLCDEDGNKVKVEVDGDEMKVTQAKHGQEATIKNGKVTAVKKLTESQLEAEFK